MQFKLFLLVLVATIACSYAAGGGVAIESQAEVKIEDESEFTKRVIPGKEFALNCTIEDDSASVQWLKDDQRVETNDRITVYSNGSLEIDVANSTDVGTYVCQEVRTIDSKVKPVRHEFRVYELSVSMLKPSRMVVEGADINITCEATGNPIPTIVWMMNDEVLTNSSSSQIVITEVAGSTPDSTLLIKEATNDNRGMYTCIIDNTEGAAPITMKTNVRVKGLYAALWPFLGIVAEVVVLCAIIFFFERRRSNAEYEESDTDTGKNGH